MRLSGWLFLLIFAIGIILPAFCDNDNDDNNGKGGGRLNNRGKLKQRQGKRGKQQRGKQGKRKDINDELGQYFGTLRDPSKRTKIKNRLTTARGKSAKKFNRQENAVDNFDWADNDPTEQGVNADIELYEGDIVLTDDSQLDKIDNAIDNPPPTDSATDAEAISRKKRKVLDTATFGPSVRWPGTVWYYYDSSISSSTRSVIEQAVAFWQSNTCLNFVQSTTATDRIVFFKGSGCYSTIGRAGGVQGISIGDGCEYFGIVTHEIGHTLGMFHEQSRTDRDSYVTIQSSNVEADALSNFQKYPTNYMNNYGTAYDLGSVMHYGPQSFAMDYSRPAILAKNSNYQNTMGQRDAPSFTDVKAINLAYNCTSKCTGYKTPCNNGGYMNPRLCSQCRCPVGFGLNCATVQTSKGSCGGTVTATSAWGTISLRSQSNVNLDCYWLIKSAVNSRIEVTFDTSKFQATCDNPCSDDYVEVKYATDFQATGPRFCCGAPSGSLRSTTNQVIIINHATLKAGFSLRYRQIY